MCSRRLLAAATLLASLALSGCGLVNFGRLPTADATLARENADLRLEKKILQQELAITRKEGDALRITIEAHAAGPADKGISPQLEAATRELTTLRASYAALQRQREAAGPGAEAPAAALQARLAETEDRLAAAWRDYTRLKADNAQLRQEVDRARGENATLAAQVQDLGARHREVQTMVAQLNSELLAQKNARAQAEQTAEALRAQLHTVVAPSRAPDRPPALGDSRESTAGGASALAAPPARETAPAPVAQSGAAPDPAFAAAGQPASPAPAPRIHKVATGETLERIARQYYGSTERWRLIYAANNKLLGNGHPLQPGMELVIPAEPGPGR